MGDRNYPERAIGGGLLKVLIVDDDFMVRVLVKEFLTSFSDCDMAVDGHEAIQAFHLAWKSQKPYDLICLDIMMPEMDGQEVLCQIRAAEKQMGIKPKNEVKVVMVTALNDPKNVFQAYSKGGATSYVVKPIVRDQLIDELRNHRLIE